MSVNHAIKHSIASTDVRSRTLLLCVFALKVMVTLLRMHSNKPLVTFLVAGKVNDHM